MFCATRVAAPQKGSAPAPRQKIKNSAGRPAELFAAENMQVHMRHGFACVLAVVDNYAESVFKPAKGGDFGNRQQESRKRLGVGFSRGGKARYGLYREKQNVDGRLRVDVVYRRAEVVFVDNFRRNFAVENLLEKCFHRPILSESARFFK